MICDGKRVIRRGRSGWFPEPTLATLGLTHGSQLYLLYEDYKGSGDTNDRLRNNERACGGIGLDSSDWRPSLEAVALRLLTETDPEGLESVLGAFGSKKGSRHLNEPIETKARDDPLHKGWFFCSVLHFHMLSGCSGFGWQQDGDALRIAPPRDINLELPARLIRSFLMASHPRLGALSPARHLPHPLRQHIYSFVKKLYPSVLQTLLRYGADPLLKCCSFQDIDRISLGDANNALELYASMVHINDHYDPEGYISTALGLFECEGETYYVNENEDVYTRKGEYIGFRTNTQLVFH